jgi:hypothetical protein
MPESLPDFDPMSRRSPEVRAEHNDWTRRYEAAVADAPTAPAGKAFKRAVRARMAETGEPYTVARRAVLADRPAPW